MKATETSIRQEMRAKLATGYVPAYDDRPENPADGIVEATYGDYGAGDGAISSTPADLATYVRMLLNHGVGPRGRLISEESFGLLTQRAIPTNAEGTSFYGYGMRSWTMDGHSMIGHDGGMIGYTSTIKADMDAALGVVVFFNGPGDPGEVGEFALRAVRAAIAKSELPALPAPEPRTRVMNASEYAGIYTSAEGKKLAFIAQGPSLSLVYQGERIPLERRGRDSFYADDADFKLFLLQFGREEKKSDDKEPAKVVEVFYGSEWFANDRYSGPRSFEVAKEWQDYVGHYRSYSPWISNLRIGLRKGKLVVLNPASGSRILVPLSSGEFQPGEEPTAERFRFESRAGGKAVRLNDSGVYLYKTFTP